MDKNSNNNNTSSLEHLKVETARELGIDLTDTENITARDAGRLGGNMVKKMTEQFKQQNEKN